MDNTLTARLYEERKIRLNQTQQQTADRANLSLHEYRQYETGEKPITIEFLQAIYYAGIDIQYMLTGYPSKHTYDDELEKLETMSKLAKSL
jgi:transcriptional regulator with XRE-family HTH domain